MPISSDKSGYVNKDEFLAEITRQVENSTLKGRVPSDGAEFGFKDDSTDEHVSSWADLLFQLAGRESSYNRFSSGDPNEPSIPGGSHGMFKASPEDAGNYGMQPGNFTMEQLHDPIINTSIGIRVLEHWMDKVGAIDRDPSTGIKGVSRYYGPIDRGWRPKKPLEVKKSPSLKILVKNPGTDKVGEKRNEFVGSLDQDLPMFSEDAPTDPTLRMM